MVFRGIMSRNWLAELRKCATDGTFHPYRRGKERGSERQVGGRKCIYFQNYIDVFTRIAVHKADKKRRKTQLKGDFKNTKRKIFRCI